MRVQTRAACGIVCEGGNRGVRGAEGDKRHERLQRYALSRLSPDGSPRFLHLVNFRALQFARALSGIRVGFPNRTSFALHEAPGRKRFRVLPPFTVGAWAHDAALTRVSVTSQTERTRDEPDRPFPSKRLSRTRTVTDDDADSDLGTTGTFDDVSSFLPPFANAENRALDLEIREKERLLEQLEGDTEDTEDRVDAMKRHLRNVEDEVRNTQSRAQARRREKETEAHMKRLSELAVARVRDDAKKMEKEELELDERVTNIETSTHFGIEKLDRYKLQLNWGQEELEQWSAASVQKDEDALALQRYQRADEARVRELNVAIEKVTAEVSKKKELLDREGTALGLSQIPASLCAHTILTLSFIYLSQRNARRAVGT